MIKEENLESVLTILETLRPEDLEAVGKRNLENYLKEPIPLSRNEEPAVAQFGTLDTILALGTLATVAQSYIELFRMLRSISQVEDNNSQSEASIDVKTEQVGESSRVHINCKIVVQDADSGELKELLSEALNLVVRVATK